MNRWLRSIPATYQSRFNYLVDWVDTPPSEARRIVEQEIRDDAEFEKRNAA
jgi:hypothetical protein